VEEAVVVVLDPEPATKQIGSAPRHLVCHLLVPPPLHPDSLLTNIKVIYHDIYRPYLASQARLEEQEGGDHGPSIKKESKRRAQIQAIVAENNIAPETYLQSLRKLRDAKGHSSVYKSTTRSPRLVSSKTAIIAHYSPNKVNPILSSKMCFQLELQSC
jgi:hypothetical protein